MESEGDVCFEESDELALPDETGLPEPKAPSSEPEAAADARCSPGGGCRSKRSFTSAIKARRSRNPLGSIGDDSSEEGCGEGRVDCEEEEEGGGGGR